MHSFGRATRGSGDSYDGKIGKRTDLSRKFGRRDDKSLALAASFVATHLLRSVAIRQFSQFCHGDSRQGMSLIKIRIQFLQPSTVLNNAVPICSSLVGSGRSPGTI